MTMMVVKRVTVAGGRLREGPVPMVMRIIITLINIITPITNSICPIPHNVMIW